jgi:UDP-glucose 4-epimerase
VERIGTITGKQAKFYRADVSDAKALEKIFAENQITAVIHFAGYKAVGESTKKPVCYYRNNLDATLTLLETMQKYGTKQIIFSSSATVYGSANPIPYTEDMPIGGCTSPYGWSKFMIEQILRDASAADGELSVVLLRYFNPIGAHESGLLGERPNGVPNNLMPYITQVAAGIRAELQVFGGDYPTPDGTGVRDYIHVVDLAKGHVAAVRYARNHTGSEVFNLGTGVGHSVMELVKTFEKVTGVPVSYRIAARRSGDLAAYYADVTKAKKLLGWRAEKEIAEMCRDSWNWQQKSQEN